MKTSYAANHIELETFNYAQFGHAMEKQMMRLSRLCSRVLITAVKVKSIRVAVHGLKRNAYTKTVAKYALVVIRRVK